MGSGGWGNNYFISLITMKAMGLGFLFYPIATLMAFKRGFTMRNAHTVNIEKEDILKLTIGEAKEKFSGHLKVAKNIPVWIGATIMITVAPVLLLFIALTIIIYF